MVAELRPILTAPRLDTRLWGGHRLGAYLSIPHPPERLAEAWLLYDDNVITEGPHEGRRLADAVKELGEALVGTRSPASQAGHFPVLLKLIDAEQRLSLQVHPDDELAAQLSPGSGYPGKTEAWYFLEGGGESRVFHGFLEPVSRHELEAALQENRVEALLRSVTVQADSALLVPARTVHAIDAGLLLFEVQQRSDLTYRVHDWGRVEADGRARELHLREALTTARLSSAQEHPVVVDAAGDRTQELIRSEHFVLERLHQQTPARLQTDPGTFEALFVTGGNGLLRSMGFEVSLKRGSTVLLPAALGAYEINPSSAGLTMLRSRLP